MKQPKRIKKLLAIDAESFRWKNQRIDGYIDEYTSGHVENTTASCIKPEY